MKTPPRKKATQPDNPETVMRLQAAVAPALAMLAGMQLEVFTHLDAAPRSATELAARLGVAEDRLSRLLYALVACGLLEMRNTGFANTPEAATFLVKGRAEYIGGTHELLSQIWHADLRTAESIRTGAPRALHDFITSSDEEMAAMLRGMHQYALAAGRDLVKRFDFSGCRALVDVGGGSGGLAAAVCAAEPALRATLFELPRTAVLARAILAETPGGEHVSIEAGDILLAPPRETHDVAVLRAVVQVMSPTDAARAIANAAAALHAGGTIYIIGAGILDDDRLNPPAAVLFNVTFLNLYRSGGSYTMSEHAAWLAAARCGEVRRVTLPTGSGIIRATKLG
jgi:hypothetical protein